MRNAPDLRCARAAAITSQPASVPSKHGILFLISMLRSRSLDLLVDHMTTTFGKAKAQHNEGRLMRKALAISGSEGFVYGARQPSISFCLAVVVDPHSFSDE